MNDHLAAYPLAYCTNVHGGTTCQQIMENLTRYAAPIRSEVDGTAPMGIGLWFSDDAAKDILGNGRLQTLARLLAEHQLVPFTLNAFPQHDFHEPVVKHRVYQPHWADPARLEYTRRTIEILHGILPSGLEGSISTLPLGWGRQTPDFLRSCARQLIAACQTLAELESKSGRLIYLCLEPEPGCTLTTVDDLVEFFQGELLESELDAELTLRYLRVCHDVCHSAVMFEPQAAVVAKYDSHGIRIGKVQVSSAVACELEWDDPYGRVRKLQSLARFIDPKYLHQTTVRIGEDLKFFEDLPLALERAQEFPASHWRVHFHVPIYLANLEFLGTTHGEITSFLDAVRRLPSDRRPLHFEVETYAWGVLPKDYQRESLVLGIADELRWLHSLVSERSARERGNSPPPGE